MKEYRPVGIPLPFIINQFMSTPILAKLNLNGSEKVVDTETMTDEAGACYYFFVVGGGGGDLVVGFFSSLALENYPLLVLMRPRGVLETNQTFPCRPLCQRAVTAASHASKLSCFLPTKSRPVHLCPIENIPST